MTGRSVLVNCDARDRHGVVGKVAGIPWRRDDRIHDVHPLRHLAEERVVLRQPPGQVRDADEELAPVRVRAGIRHRERAPDVIASNWLVGEGVARTARSDSARVQRRLLAVLAVADLGDEPRDDAVEDDVVVVALVRED